MPRIKLISLMLIITGLISYGQFAPPAGSAGSTAIHCDSSIVAGWATSISVERGYLNIADRELGFASTGIPSNGLGKADNMVISLGDSGIAVVGFDRPVTNIPGYDFAVYENSFDGVFLELAHVEVSTDSTRWVRFPSVSNTSAEIQVDTYGTLDASSLYNLAGKYQVYWGTPFDLEEIKDSSGIDIYNINYVKVIDVVGSVSAGEGTFDSRGTIINDPWPTSFASSGFDLDAVAVLGFASSKTDARSAQFKIYPQPASGFLNIRKDDYYNTEALIIDLAGRLLFSQPLTGSVTTINIANLRPGAYLVKLAGENSGEVEIFIKR